MANNVFQLIVVFLTLHITIAKPESETQLTLSYDQPDFSPSSKSKSSSGSASTYSSKRSLPDPRVRLFYSTGGGVPAYGLGEDYFHSYLHDFPLFWQDAEEYISSAKLPSRYRFSGTMDTRSLLYR